MDECYDYRGWCEGTCINYIGGYDCICPEGQSLNDDGWTCGPSPTTGKMWMNVVVIAAGVRGHDMWTYTR